MTDLTEQEVCIGSLGQQKVYLHWSDVKDICTYAVSAAYEQVREENAQLKIENKWYSEQLNEAAKEISHLKELLTMVKPVLQLEYNVTENRNLIKKIDEALK